MCYHKYKQRILSERRKTIMKRTKRALKICSFLIFLMVLVSFMPSFALAASSKVSASQLNGVIPVFYGILAAVSFLMTIGYLIKAKKKELKFIFLYSSVFLAILGYFLISVSKTLDTALWANRLSYLGSASAVCFMLLIIMDVCDCRRSKGLSVVLYLIAFSMFLLASTGGWLDLYYTNVSIESIGGATSLVKEYGSLHCLYSVFLFVYFALMIAVCVHSIFRKKNKISKYATALLFLVLFNIVIWFAEQNININFEFLSVSYVITEVFLFLIYGMLREYEELQNTSQKASPASSPAPAELDEVFASFAEKYKLLSAAEKRILKYYIEGYEISEIPDLAYISINTVKKHNRNIYQKFEVSSRDELMVYIDLLRKCGKLSYLE